tara:strand:- start:20 stop:289 length:270 start_codon:yes stop_codon:yes gene_type:complete
MKTFNKKRFILNVTLKSKHFPNLPQDIELIKDKEFYTLKEIAEELNLTYPNINNIYKKKTLKCGTKKTWVDCPLSPVITIDKIKDEFGN